MHLWLGVAMAEPSGRLGGWAQLLSLLFHRLAPICTVLLHLHWTGQLVSGLWAPQEPDSLLQAHVRQGVQQPCQVPTSQLREGERERPEPVAVLGWGWGPQGAAGSGH